MSIKPFSEELSLKLNINIYRGKIDIKKDDDTGNLIVQIEGTVEANIKADARLIQSVRVYLTI